MRLSMRLVLILTAKWVSLQIKPLSTLINLCYKEPFIFYVDVEYARVEKEML